MSLLDRHLACLGEFINESPADYMGRMSKPSAARSPRSGRDYSLQWENESMQYDALVKDTARAANVDPKTVRAVLASVPDVLTTLTEGEKVRTPLGVFRMTKRKGREVTIPTSDKKVEIGPEMVVKLKPGSKLRKEA